MDNPDLYHGNKIAKRDTVEFLEEVKPLMPWPPGETVLDVGSGPGDTTEQCLTPCLGDGYRIVGGDISKSMVEYAKKNHGNVQMIFKSMDISDENIFKNWDKGVYDKIFSFYCLHWVSNQLQAVKNMHALLKNGGHVVLMLPNLHPCLMLFKGLQENIKWLPYTEKLETWDIIYDPKLDTLDEYRSMLKKTGFEIIKCKEVEKVWVHTSYEGFSEYLESINPFVANIPKDRKDEFLSDCQTMLFEYGLMDRNNEMEITQKYTLLYIVAKKLS